MLPALPGPMHLPIYGISVDCMHSAAMATATVGCTAWAAQHCCPCSLACRSTAQRLPLRPARLMRAAAATAAVQLTELQLGKDIPVALQWWAVGDRRFLLVVPSIDAVMEMYIAAGQPDRDPYWCEPWPSALAMAEELLHRPDLVAGKRVCELGCGLGLAGLAAAMAGAAEVVLLDREPLALQCALLNAALNGVPTEAASSGMQALSLQQLLPHLQSVDVAQLEEQQQELGLEGQRRQLHATASTSAAGNGAGLNTRSNDSNSSSRNGSDSSSSRVDGSISGRSSSSRVVGAVCAKVFDWSRPVTLSRHDVCLVCDCLYEAFSVQPVAEVASKLLKLHGSRLLLADPPDRARHNRECFLDILCEGSGQFVVEESGEKAVQVFEASKEAWRSIPVAMMHLRRAAGGDTVGVKLGHRGGRGEMRGGLHSRLTAEGS